MVKNSAKILTYEIKSLPLPCDNITPRNFERVNLSATIKFVTATPSGVAFLFDALCQLVSKYYLCQQQNNAAKRNKESHSTYILFHSFPIMLLKPLNVV